MTRTQSADAASPRTRSWRRRLLITLVLCALGVALLPLLLPPVLKLAAPPLARRLAGFELEIGKIDRADWSGLSMRDLRLRDLGEAATLEQLSVNSIDLSYGRALFTGNLDGIESLEATGIDVILARSDGSLEEARTDEQIPFEIPARLPRVDLQDAKFTLRADSGQDLLLSQVVLTIDDDNAIRLSGIHDLRPVMLSGDYASGQISNLRLEVDDESLLAPSSVDLSRMAEGAMSADLKIQVGSMQGALELALDQGVAEWKLDVPALNLNVLQKRLPFQVSPTLAGRVQLEFQGSLEVEQPLQARSTLSFRTQDVTYEEWKLEEARGHLRTADGVLSMADVEIVQGPLNRAAIREAEIPLEGIDAVNWLERARGAFELDLRDWKSLLEPAGLWQIESGELQAHRLNLRAQWREARLSILEGFVEAGPAKVELSRAELWVEEGAEPRLAVQIVGDAQVPSLEGFGRAVGREGWRGALGGELSLSGTWPQLEGRMELSGQEVVLEGLQFGELELALRTGSSARELLLERASFVSEYGSLRSRARIQATDAGWQAELQELELQNAAGGLSLQAPATIEVDPESGRVSDVHLQGAAGDLRLSANWAAKDIDAELSVRELHSEIFFAGLDGEVPELGTANFRAGLHYDGERLDLDSQGLVQRLKVEELGEVDLEWNLSHDGARWLVKSAQVRGDGGLVGTLRGDLPLQVLPELVWGTDELQAELELDLPLSLLPGDYAGQLAARGELRGTWQALFGELRLDGSNLRLPADLHPEDLENGRIAGEIRLGEAIECRDLEISLGELFDMRLDAKLHGSVDLPELIANSGAAARRRELEAQLDLGALDLERLGPLLSRYTEAAEVLRRGQVQGGFGVRGSLDDPKFSGALQIDDARLRLGAGLPPVESLAGRLALDDQLLRVETLTGTLGAAPFVMSGNVRLDTDSPQLDFKIDGENLLLVRDTRTNVRANTDLRVSGPLNALVASGSVELTKGRYSPDTRFLNLRPGPASSGVRGFQLFSFREAPLRDLSFDVRLEAKRPFEITNNIVRGSMRPRLHLGGTGLVPVLTGDVFLDQTFINLPSTRLELTGGTVQFNEANPFVPTVDVVGNTRMLGYDIRAQISGDYDDTEVLFSSSPALPQEDLFLLVLTGRLPEDPERSNALSTANTVALYLARDTVSRWFADDGPINQDSLLERLEFQFGKDVSKNGTETVSAAFRLTNKQGLPEEEQHARHLFLSAERDKFEDYNYGLRIVFRFRR